MNYLLEVTVDSFADRLSYGGFMLLTGIAIVFSVLIIIWASLVLFKIYFSKAEVKPSVVEAPIEAAPSQNITDAEIVAVIAAAIAAAEAESSGLKFRVVSFKRK